MKSETLVAVSKSRATIDKILSKWGVIGIQWEDDFDIGLAQLRFRWKRENGSELVARFRIEVDSEEGLKEKAKDGRSGIFSEKKYNRLKINRGKKEHRILLNLIRNMFAAINEGIIPAEALLLPWLEDGDGYTVYDKISPRLDLLSTKPLYDAIGPEKEDKK